MYKIFIILAAVAGFVYFLVKLCRSSKFDKFYKDLFSGKLNTDSTTKESIRDISKAEDDLNKQADQNTKEANRLKKESQQAKDYLSSKGDGSTEKKEGSG